MQSIDDCEVLVSGVCSAPRMVTALTGAIFCDSVLPGTLGQESIDLRSYCGLSHCRRGRTPCIGQTGLQQGSFDCAV